ncbi:scabin-related ADP-ribosyltransferase [Luteibacter sahnii]|uniref:scabin-related ADP-ribosyltransferase n=1 Tax=Luteibacter sahnii TaxID=3021977 RepID=UPI002A6AD265|nr:enterotoxin A family protein [Luteibacter sp. PPL193]MDY1546691.1 enterotoxin A family protein [Luteibacter sp. PPL193]
MSLVHRIGSHSLRWGLLSLFLVACTARANFLYRADTRPPSDVFQNGFTPWGDNTSLFLHVVGLTCQPGDQTTGFVATTRSEPFAIGWGRNHQSNGTHFYVYRIRAGPQFFNAARSLFHAADRSGDSTYEYTGWTYLAENEWVSHRPIAAGDIIDAVEYISRGRDTPPERGLEFANPRTQDTPGTLSRAPYEWNYQGDTMDGAGPSSLVCASTCFSSQHHALKKRDARDPDDPERWHETSRNIEACRAWVRATTALLLRIVDESQRNEPR